MSIIARGGTVPLAPLTDYHLRGPIHGKLVGASGSYLLTRTAAFPTATFSVPQIIATGGAVPNASLTDYLLVGTTHGKLVGEEGAYLKKQVVLHMGAAPPAFSGDAGTSGAAGTISRWNALRGVFE